MTRRPICSLSGPSRSTRTGDPFHLTAPGPIPKERQLFVEIFTVPSDGSSRPTPGMEGKGWNGFRKARWIERGGALAGRRIGRSLCMVWEFWMDDGIWPDFFPRFPDDFGLWGRQGKFPSGGRAQLAVEGIRRESVEVHFLCAATHGMGSPLFRGKTTASAISRFAFLHLPT